MQWVSLVKKVTTEVLLAEFRRSALGEDEGSVRVFFG